MGDSQFPTHDPGEVHSPSDQPTLHTQHGSGTSAAGAPETRAVESCETGDAPSSASFVGGYEILEELGRGGMGVIYKARQKGLGRIVALKMILHGDHAGVENRLRFLREAEALAQLRHENIVQVYEVGEFEEKPFISLEYVEGGSLDKRLREGPLPAGEAAQLVERLAKAMQAAHDVGIIHRDLKPANVLLQKDVSRQDAMTHSKELGKSDSNLGGLASSREILPKITDFGLAKRQDAGGLSASGAILGTPSYMAPEQAAGKGREVDARADVYALGAILYECLTGRPPFRAASAVDTMMQVINEEPVPVRSLQPTVRQDLETICLKCLQKEPGLRYGSARSLAEDLSRYGREEPVLARPIGRLVRGWRWGKRNPAVATLLGAVALLLVLGTAISTAFGLHAQTERDRANTEATRANNETSKVEKALQELTVREREERLAKEREKKARNEEVRQRKETERLLYSGRLSLAQSYWADGDTAAAREKLDEALEIRIDPEQETRDTWEHRYLHTLMNHHCQRTFLGHSTSVNCVCFSPDGRQIASASSDYTVKLWDSATGQELHTLKGHTSAVNCVSFAPDGRSLATGSWHHGTLGDMKVWDASTGRVLLNSVGHQGRIECVSFSPDGKRIATGSNDATVKVWDSANGQELLNLKGHTYVVRSVSFSPDGKRLVAGHGDWDKLGKLTVWDTSTGQSLFTLKGHMGGVYSVSFSPDGKRLASAGRLDQTVTLWDASTGKDLLTLKGHTGVACVSFSPDSKRLASADGLTIKILDVSTGQDLITLKGHTSGVQSVSFSPDGKRLASGSDDKTVKMWNAVTGQDILTFKGHTNYVYGVSFSPDGKRLASGSEDATVKVWDTYSGRDLLTLKGHRYAVYSVSFSRDGTRLASAGQDQTVKLWDASTGKDLLTLKGHTNHVHSVSFSPDGKRLASGSDDKTVKVWDTVTGQDVLTLKGHTQRVACVSFSPDGKRIASASGDQTVKVWEAATGRELLTLKEHTTMFFSVCFSPDGKRLASGTGSSVHAGEIKVWDANTGQDLLTLKGHTGIVASVSFSPDGKRLVSGGDKTVKVWDAVTGQDILTLRHTVGVACVSFSPDGKRLASASADNTVKVWDASARQDVSTLKGHTNRVTSVSFSPDSKRLASVSEDKTVKVWDAVTGQILHTLKGHTRSITSVNFSPDGKRLASASFDNTVKVWDAIAGQDLLTLKGHSQIVYCVTFSPDGKRLASGSEDKTVKVWDVATGQDILTLKGHTKGVDCVSFSPDGMRLTSHEVLGKQVSWNLTTGQQIDGIVGEADYVASGSPRSLDGCFFAHVDNMVIRVYGLSSHHEADSAGPRWWIAPDFHWHTAQANESWRDGNWFAAAFHHDWQLREWPWDANLHVRHAHVLNRLKRTAESSAHLLHAVLLDPRVNQWPLDPDAARRGQTAAQNSDWLQAIADLELAAHQPAATPDDWKSLLLAQGGAGYHEAARQSCRALLDRFENDPKAANHLVFATHMIPCVEKDAVRLVEVAKGVIDNRRDALTTHWLGSALYRAGRLREAVLSLNESVKLHDKGGYIDTWLFMAMIQQRLGFGAQARQNLAHVEAWLKGRKFDTWQETIRWKLLQAEARALILTMPRVEE